MARAYAIVSACMVGLENSHPRLPTSEGIDSIPIPYE